MTYLRNSRLVLLIIVVLLITAVQPLSAQAPDCEQCDDVIDDPIAYAECVEQYCNDAIPIDSNVWILVWIGIGMGGYTFYKIRNKEDLNSDRVNCI